MKIFAKIDNDNVLCEVSVNEWALIKGFKGKWDDKFNRDLRVGDQCELAKIASTSHFIRTIDKDVLVNLKNHLTEAISKIDDAKGEASKLTIFETLKNEDVV